jgi:RNA polymerase sigma-70 factor (ECF subfamily)
VTPIFRFVYFRVGKWDDAEDLTQMTFLKAWNAMPRFEERGNPFSSLLYAIARNVIVDYWRKKREISLEEHEETIHQIEDEKQNPSLDAETKEAKQNILKAVDELSEGQQEIIMLKFIEGLSNKEIANITGKSGEAIRALQYRGLRVLRTYFKEHAPSRHEYKSR